MIDGEKVIKEIKAKITYAETTDQIYSDAVRVRLLKDVLELLKEQEAIHPGKRSDGNPGKWASWWYICGNCGRDIDCCDKFCWSCGRAVKWE